MLSREMLNELNNILSNRYQLDCDDAQIADIGETLVKYFEILARNHNSEEVEGYASKDPP